MTREKYCLELADRSFQLEKRLEAMDVSFLRLKSRYQLERGRLAKDLDDNYRELKRVTSQIFEERPAKAG